jgi:beta-N-acetylhexosaminidase
MTIRSFISGCAGIALSQEEVQFFKKTDPWGLILFKRNCESPDQIRNLTAQFRGAVDRKDAPVFIDQEGGRVQRLVV